MQAKIVRTTLAAKLHPVMRQLGFKRASTKASWTKPYGGQHLMVWVYLSRDVGHLLWEGRTNGWFAIEMGLSKTGYLTHALPVSRHQEFLTLEEKSALSEVENLVRGDWGYPPLEPKQAGHHCFETPEHLDHYTELLAQYLPDILSRYEDQLFPR